MLHFISEHHYAVFKSKILVFLHLGRVKTHIQMTSGHLLDFSKCQTEKSVNCTYILYPIDKTMAGARSEKWGSIATEQFHQPMDSEMKISTWGVYRNVFWDQTM